MGIRNNAIGTLAIRWVIGYIVLTFREKFLQRFSRKFFSHKKPQAI